MESADGQPPLEQPAGPLMTLQRTHASHPRLGTVPDSGLPSAGVQTEQPHGALDSEGPALGLRLCCHHLEILYSF